MEARHPDRGEIGEGGTPADSLSLLPLWVAHECINGNPSSEQDVQLRRTHITTNLVASGNIADSVVAVTAATSLGVPSSWLALLAGGKEALHGPLHGPGGICRNE